MPGDDLLSMLLRLGAGFLFIMYVIAPLVVAWRVRTPGPKAFEPADPDTFLRSRNDALRRIHDELGALGLTPVAATWLVNRSMRAQVLVYRKAGDPALGLVLQQSRTSSLVITSFEQPFADGTRLILTNSPFAAIFPAWDRVRGFRIAGAAPAVAWREFVTLRGRQHAARRDLVPGQEVPDLEAQHRETIARLLGLGRYLPAADGQLRMRVAEAYRASWRMLWPWSTLLAWRDARRVRSLTREPISS
jgi:hypothetical protein